MADKQDKGKTHIMGGFNIPLSPIPEIKQDEQEGLQVLVDGKWFEASKEFKDTVKSIDEGLKGLDRPEREKITEILEYHGVFDVEDEILALFPDIEHLIKQLKLADKNYLDLKNAFDERVEEAKKQERERIIKEVDGLLNISSVGGKNLWLNAKKWKALKGEINGNQAETRNTTETGH